MYTDLPTSTFLPYLVRDARSARKHTFFSPQNRHFIIKYSFGGENTVFGITEYSF